ncbi:MAG: tetratricopeptide repeat protein, partial [Acidobacteriota bacterium]
MRQPTSAARLLAIALITAGCAEPESTPTPSPTAGVTASPQTDAATARLLDEVTSLHRAGRYEEGSSLLRGEISRDPERPRLHYNLGVFEASTGSYESAVEAFGEELARFPDHTDSHRALAVAFVRLGRLEDAQPHFERCILDQPGDALCRFELGKSYSTLGMFADARPNLEAAAELRDDAAGYAELALLYRRLGENERAFTAFSKALADDP